ncbi:MAG: glutathione S-transferase family protein [SAR324 cluster bacterium]|nr:glutathione S-transferase family protein [SAR324 cluster bacterium]
MGMLVEGKWMAEEPPTAMQDGRGAFVRADSLFRDVITADGGSGFPAAVGRYHLFLAHNCPWAHRTLICLNLKGLRNAVGVSLANPRRDEQGWWYAEGLDEFQPERGRFHLHRVYAAAVPDYTGRVTTPTLWDRQARRIVSNESAEIVRMFNSAFDGLGDSAPDLYPEPLREKIGEVNELVYAHINNGVYRCGFARSQQAYEEAFVQLFDALDKLEERLERHRYLVGPQLTEADLRLFPTLVRFDAVYYGHFKCNLRRIADYPNLSNYLRDLVQQPAFGETVRVDIYKQGYYGNSPRLNPSGIVPLGPQLNFEAPHDRATRAYSA